MLLFALLEKAGFGFLFDEQVVFPATRTDFYFVLRLGTDVGGFPLKKRSDKCIFRQFYKIKIIEISFSIIRELHLLLLYQILFHFLFFLIILQFGAFQFNASLYVQCYGTISTILHEIACQSPGRRSARYYNTILRIRAPLKEQIPREAAFHVRCTGQYNLMKQTKKVVLSGNRFLVNMKSDEKQSVSFRFLRFV